MGTDRRRRPALRCGRKSDWRRVRRNSDHGVPGLSERRVERRGKLRRDVDRSRDGAPSAYEVRARRFNSSGAPQGGEIIVNTYTTGTQAAPTSRSIRPATSSSSGTAGGLNSGQPAQDGDSLGVFARRFDASGNPLSAEFQVNQYTTGNQARPTIAMRPTGEFIVVWASPQDDQLGAIMARRYDSSGNPIGGSSRSTRGSSKRSTVRRGARSGRKGDRRLDELCAGWLRHRRLRPAAGRSREQARTGVQRQHVHDRSSCGARVAAGDRRDRSRRVRHHLAVAGTGWKRLRHPRPALLPNGRRYGVELPVNNFTAGFQGIPRSRRSPTDSSSRPGRATAATARPGIAARLAGVPRVESTVVDHLHSGARRATPT